jgi:DNA primase catalytic core
MEIPEIKAQLTIAQVLDHYNLKPDKSTRMCCPFHEDKTPSMQVYYKTHTAYCFSSNCTTHGKSLDVIDFIMHMEKCSKHEAIVKAQELINGTGTAQPLTRVAVLTKMFAYFKNATHSSTPAKEYLKSRNLDHNKLEIGYNSGQFHHGNRKGAQLIESCVKVGLLLDEGLTSKTKEKAYRVFGKWCAVFALRNVQGQVVSLYFRSTINNSDQKHFYLRDRQGLYPNYPKAETTKLILTEAIIDAGTLLQVPEITERYSVLACYGTNGLTQEHEQAIKELKQLEEIIFFFDGDEAGRKAKAHYTESLQQLRPDVKISSVNTPEGEDVNSLVQGHEADILTHLIAKRHDLSFSIEVPKPKAEPIKTGTQEITGTIDTTNPYKITYQTTTANYYVKGGLRNEPDSLRVSLDIEHPQTKRKSRSKLDLYEDKQIEKIAREASEKLNLRSDLIQLDLEILTDLLEQHREKQSAPKETTPTENKISPQYEKQATEFLTKPNLIRRWNELIGKAGVVGEENNRMFLMAIGITYKMDEPLHALIQGSSGSGKTHLMAKVYNFIPPPDKKNFTRITEGSLYNWGMYDLCHKLICIEDLDGLKEEALFAWRELMSKGVIISATSIKDDNGNISASERIVYGPIASMSCTTKGEIYEDNMGRCFIIAVDESAEQSKKVIRYQNMKASGQIDEVKEKQCTEFIQTMVSLLKSYEVINPYADKVHLPDEAHKIRRLNGLYQAFVKAITLMHQYQRKKDERGRLISDKEDLQTAAEILFESILLKVDELDGSLRQFYERLKLYIKTKGNGHHESYEFGQREVRQALHVSKTQLQRYLNDLLQLEYIRQSGGYSNRGFNYKVLYWDNVQVMRAKVKRHLQGQLDQLELTAA